MKSLAGARGGRKAHPKRPPTATTLEFDTYLNDGSRNFLMPGDSRKQIQNYTGEYQALWGARSFWRM